MTRARSVTGPPRALKILSRVPRVSLSALINLLPPAPKNNRNSERDVRKERYTKAIASGSANYFATLILLKSHRFSMPQSSIALTRPLGFVKATNSDRLRGAAT